MVPPLTFNPKPPWQISQISALPRPDTFLEGSSWSDFDFEVPLQFYVVTDYQDFNTEKVKKPESLFRDVWWPK